MQMCLVLPFHLVILNIANILFWPFTVCDTSVGVCGGNVYLDWSVTTLEHNNDYFCLHDSPCSHLIKLN